VSTRPATDPRVADLVRGGRLRVGLGPVALHWAIKDAQTGELRGVAVDLARALAEHIGVAFEPVTYPSPPNVLDGLATKAWDIAFLGMDPARAAAVDYAPPHIRIEATFVVPAGSAVRSIADADRPGVRIAVARGSVEETVLRHRLKHAEVLGTATGSAGFESLRNGAVEVLAAPTPAAIGFAARLPGSRMLEGSFHTTYGAIAVAKGEMGWLGYVAAFIEQAKASGLVQHAIDRAGVRGVAVAPPGYPS